MNIYCSGIGGIGLSAYAALQRELGHTVQGSDRTRSIVTDDLEERGIDVFFEQDGSHVSADIDLFVYSEAVPETSPERTRATELAVRQVSYFHALGELSAPYTVIAVCGTHGKSSTTSMAAKVLTSVGLDPTVVVGTRVPDLDGRNWRKGESDIFLLEACEYMRSFHYLSPDIILMTSCDGDHYDYYKDEADYQKAYADFLSKLPSDGLIITHGNDSDCKRLAEESGKRWIDADELPLPTLQVPGRHMQQNAQLVALLGKTLDVNQEETARALHDYKGCWRRMEVKGETESGVLVIDDYGHHPVEVQATLSALKEWYPSRRLVVAFQPHTHDRTLKLYKEFTHSFSDADMVLVPGVYDARHHTETDTVDVQKFVLDIATQSRVDTRWTKSLDATKQLLTDEVLQTGDLLLTLGAGDITSLSDTVTSRLRSM